MANFSIDERLMELTVGCEKSTVYYSDENRCKQSAPVTNIIDTEIAIPPTSLPGSASFSVQNIGLNAQAVLRFRVAIPSGVAAPKAWGAMLIQSIEVRIGGSPQYQFSGESNFLRVMKEAETVTKRDWLLDCMGPALTDNHDFAGTTPGVGIYEALVPIHLPSSTVKSLSDKLPLDLSLVTGTSYSIQVMFKPGASVFTSNGATTGALVPTALRDGQLLLRNQQFHSASESLRDYYFQHPDKFYSYPFVAMQSPASVAFTGSTDLGAPATFNLSSFKAGNCLGISMYIVKSSDLTNTSSSPYNPYNAVPVDDLQLYLNGSPIQRFRGKSWRLLNAANQYIDSPTFSEPYLYPITPTPAAVPYFAFGTIGAPNQGLPAGAAYTWQPWYDFQFSQHDQVRTGDHISEVGLDLTNQTLQVSCVTPSGGVSYTAFVTFYYASDAILNNKANIVY